LPENPDELFRSKDLAVSPFIATCHAGVINAPHLVVPEKMLLLIIKDGALCEFTTPMALSVYDYLVGAKKREH
jgi:hypothetical protein